MKTLYVDIDESISQVMQKITRLKSSQILLVIPKGAQILQNRIHLQVLKQKAEEEKKDLALFTNDPKGKVMIAKVGLKVYQGHVRKRQQQKPAHISGKGSAAPKKLPKKVSITDVSQETRRKKQTPKSMSSPKKKQQRQE